MRKADEPPDPEHPYGHEKVENLAAAIEGMLILVGAGIIVFEATRRLVVGAEVEHLGVGIAVIGFSAVANFAVSALCRPARPRAPLGRAGGRRGAPARRRADLGRRAGRAGPGRDHRRGRVRLDRRAGVAAAIVFAGLRILTGSSRVLVDEAPPPEELDRIEAAIVDARPPEMVGYHKLRARRAGARRYIDLHVQFRSGTTLERAHSLAHGLRDAIEAEVPDSDVLIHVEPGGGDPGSREPSPIGPDSRLDDGASAEAQSRFTAAEARPRRPRSGSRCSRRDRTRPRSRRDHDGEPGGSLEGHVYMFAECSVKAQSPERAAAEAAVARLAEMSADLRGCAVLDPEGRALAASGDPDGWAEAGAAFLEAADAAGGEPVAHVHVGDRGRRGVRRPPRAGSRWSRSPSASRLPR